MTSPTKKNEEQGQPEPSGWRPGQLHPLPANDPLYKIGPVIGGTYTRGPSNATKETNSSTESERPKPTDS